MPQQAELPFATPQIPAADETPRAIALGDRIVPYLLRRSARRTIGLSIDQRGLRVAAPRRTAVKEIEAMIHAHAAWVAQKLDEWRSRRRPEALRVIDGLRLPFYGGEIVVRLSVGRNRFVWHEREETSLTLLLRAPEDAARVLENALRAKAADLFARRLSHFAERFALPIPPLALSSARTRWGSCSRKSGVRLNWRLIHFPSEIIDYVVVHELAHLREMNHSPRFWALVGQHYPDYPAARRQLKALAAHCPQIGG